MSNVSNGRWSNSWKIGLDAEELFVKTMESKGHVVEKTSIEVDRKSHIDFYVDGYGFDVKGNRKLNSIWLEIVNVQGNDGWLKGEAHFIAFLFEKLDHFKVFKREDLLYWVANNVHEMTDNNREHLKLYTRPGRQDLIVKVKYEHIRHLPHSVIKC